MLTDGSPTLVTMISRCTSKTNIREILGKKGFIMAFNQKTRYLELPNKVPSRDRAKKAWNGLIGVLPLLGLMVEELRVLRACFVGKFTT